MEALAQARRALEQRRDARDAAEGAIEEACVKALSRRCAKLREQLQRERGKDQAAAAAKQTREAPSPRARPAQDHASRPQVREQLVAFYEQHNSAKVKEVDTVLDHFEGRLEALNEALLLQYGKGIKINAKDDAAAAAAADIRKNLAADTASPRTMLEALVTRNEELFRAAAEEMFLPRHKFNFRSSSGKSMVGLEDFWVEEIAGTIRADLCLKSKAPPPDESGATNGQNAQKPKTPGRAVPIPELGLRTAKPIKVICRTNQLKIVDKVVPADPPESGIGKTFTLDSLDVECEVDFSLVFEYRRPHPSSKRRRWRAAPSFSFEVSKLKTQRTVVDSLLRTVINSALPAAIRRACEKYLVDELGTLMLDARMRSANEDRPMGLAILCEVLIRGWPPRRAFGVNLYRSLKTNEQKLVAQILRKLNATPDQMQTLHALNEYYAARVSSTSDGQTSSRSSFRHWVGRAARGGSAAKDTTPVWARGLFPLQAITLEELINLRSGLFVADLVASTTSNADDLASDEEAAATTDEELFTASEQSESEDSGGDDDDDEAAEEEEEGDDKGASAGASAPGGSADQNAGAVKGARSASAGSAKSAAPAYVPHGLNDFKSQEASTEFAREYNEVVARAVRAQADAQTALDEICDKDRVPRWSLAKLVQRLERHVLCKEMSAELHVHAVDCRLDADVTIQTLQSLFWKELRLARSFIGEIAYQRQLKALHQVFTSAKLAVIAIKSLAGNLRFTFTGAVTGGNLPAFELSLKDLTSEGVVDLQLSNLRVGGNFKEFIVWFISFLKQMRSRSAMSRKQKKRSTEAIRALEQDVLRHVELLQFFLDLELAMAHHQQGDVSLICAMTAQKENPRPALSGHVAGELFHILPHDTRHFPHALEARSLALQLFTADPGIAQGTGAKLAAAISNEIMPPAISLARNLLGDDGLRTRELSSQEAHYIAGFSALLLASVDGDAFIRALDPSDGNETDHDEDGDGAEIGDDYDDEEDDHLDADDETD